MSRSSLDGTLAALAEPHRRRVIELLRRGPRPAGELAISLRLSPPATSRHLRVLRREGLVEEARGEEDARLRVYRLRPRAFRPLQRWLDELESFWSEQLAAFQRFVDEDPI